jgi:hypothetical protein
MRIKLIFYIFLVLTCSCNNSNQDKGNTLHEKNVALANELIDAFYSFNVDSLELILYDAPESKPNILYYQKWAECGNYEIIERFDCIIKNDSQVICPIKVKDDLIGALKIDFNVTDTFHITIEEGHIQSVETSSNDPQMYYEAKEWVKLNLPDLIGEPCEGIWEGGPTPCECVKAMVAGYTEFIANNYPEKQ